MMVYDLYGVYEIKIGLNVLLKGYFFEIGVDWYMNDVRFLFVYEFRDN